MLSFFIMRFTKGIQHPIVHQIEKLRYVDLCYGHNLISVRRTISTIFKNGEFRNNPDTVLISFFCGHKALTSQKI